MDFFLGVLAGVDPAGDLAPGLASPFLGEGVTDDLEAAAAASLISFRVRFITISSTFFP